MKSSPTTEATYLVAHRLVVLVDPRQDLDDIIQDLDDIIGVFDSVTLA